MELPLQVQFTPNCSATPAALVQPLTAFTAGGLLVTMCKATRVVECYRLNAGRATLVGRREPDQDDTGVRWIVPGSCRISSSQSLLTVQWTCARFPFGDIPGRHRREGDAEMPMLGASVRLQN